MGDLNNNFGGIWGKLIEIKMLGRNKIGNSYLAAENQANTSKQAITT